MRSRCAHATYLAAAAGLNVAAESCGHSSPNVTRKHYIDESLIERGRRAYQIPRPEIDQQQAAESRANRVATGAWPATARPA